MLNNFLSKAKIKTWHELIGKPSMFPLERRIFHSICIGLILLLCFYVPYNLYAGLYIGSASALFVGLFFFYQYYYSRFHNRPHNSILFGLIGILIFGVNYFTNSGIHGSTDLIWPVYLLLVLAISPYEQHVYWLIIYLLSFFAVHLVEFYFPLLVEHPFEVGKGQFIDRITAFPIPVIGLYIIIKFIRRSYDKERKTAEEKTLAVQTLMSIISHDLRTPLMNVQNYLEMLKEHELSSSERKALESTLLNSTNSTMAMLSNLLHWSKSQMDGPYVELKEIDLHSTLQVTMEMEQMQALRKSIVLTQQISPNLVVHADADMLQLVVRNLISNAVKFTPQGGAIHVEAQLVEDGCSITVSDNGIGIAAEKQGKLFSMKSGPEFGTNNERGVGLGLVLCKEFMERQGGRISFESTPGLGSRFSIFLPARVTL